MGGLRRLKRKGADRHSVGRLYPSSGPQGEKLSAVILDFARPLTDNVDDDGFENAIALATLCWNVALLPEDQQEQELRLITSKMAKDAPAWWVRDLKTWTRQLVDRKKKLFAHDRRMVVNYTIEDDGGDFHLHVASTVVPPAGGV